MDDQAVKAQKIVHWLVWGALTMALLVYVLVLQLAGRDAEQNQPSQNIQSILWVVSGAGLLVSFSIRFLVTRRSASRDKGKPVAVILPSYIVSLALTETVGMFGLQMGLMGASPDDYMPFFIVSFFAMLLQPPTFLRRGATR